MAGDLLARVSAEIDERLEQLRPLLAEYERLLSAAEALEAKSAGPAAGESSPAPRTRMKAPGKGRAGRRRGSAAGVTARAVGAGATKRSRAPRGAAQRAILAALEHGSHTAGELAVVTAMSGSSIRQSLGGLVRAGAVGRARREGKAAYALARAARHI
jgi:hypothetical protein